jgi:hypothetical protein
MTLVSQDVSREGGFVNRFSPGGAFGLDFDLSRQHLMIGSLPKVGKSRLTGDNPDALVLNFDFTQADPRTRAAVWPIRGSDGQACETGPGGLKKISAPTFKGFLEIQDQLIAMAKRNDPNRPKTIVVDTVSKMCDYVQDHLVETRQKTSFKELGQDGWAERNRLVEKFSRDFVRAGYGVIDLIHLSYRNIPVSNTDTNQTLHTRECLPTISDGLWRSLFVGPSLIATVELKPVTEQVNGKPTLVKKRVLRVAKNALDMDTGGTRFNIPDEIVLSAEHPWDSLVEAVRNAS